MNQPGSTRRPIGGLSHVRGSTEVALCETTVYALLEQAARRWPQRDAAVFVEQGIRWTWAELREQVDRAAAGFARLGVVKGERVGIWSPNRAEWLVTQFATARLGAILVNINPAYRLAELEYALHKAGVGVLVSAAAFKTGNYLGMLQNLGIGPSGRTERLPQLRSVVRLGDEPTAGMLNWALMLDAGMAVADALPDPAALDCREPINIQFTSGTTGAPKGATLTHHNIVNNARAVAQCMRLGADDALCIPVPLYHCFGMVLSVLACVASGAKMVFPGEGFDARATLAAVESERCTALHGVPTMFIAELDHPEFARFDLGSLRTGIMAGAPCPIEVMRRVQADMHMHEVTIAYGMTETSPVSFQSATDDPLDKRVTTVGRVLPHLEVKIVDIDGRTVPVGAKGELCTRGYSVMLGYWNDPERTEDAVRGGWMHTGDLATLDEQGYCNIVGRVKDMVIRGGENVYPREVEEFLFRHPKVAAVQVFGVPDTRYGEELCAWIITRPGVACTEDEVRAFCRDQIAHYKVPRYIRFVDELPVTVTGKPQKFLMRDAMMRELGLSVAATA
ncbi:MAG: AMP-binding protein [Proteobacteria bacterium]|uniref:AMP-binding protein n=1 Tax=Piscinibacter sp. TaxID=1903157 RepID=UPI001B556BED|nr:AMP-binding protein [Piscinibacter sp.]MBP5990786.1 AMP-binding protein [Piscinibacter sp.]MBP6028196.1 AMP-binding protein [Piscinibacter sp.]MBS0443351.1 AMP-binding protein [Pseudomonadota bacterium]